MANRYVEKLQIFLIKLQLIKQIIDANFKGEIYFFEFCEISHRLLPYKQHFNRKFFNFFTC